ncbi:hypothetical protein GF325_12875 [Candidatus Bathyarchaeota archaeon]|nr:hypothetical protein [Candidatus Bathyarchaeota archaeon]
MVPAFHEIFCTYHHEGEITESDYMSLRNFSHATPVINRLNAKYLPFQPDIIAGIKKGMLAKCRNVTGSWSGKNDRIRGAFSWSCFPGVEMVITFLEDDEYGKDISWYFSNKARDLLGIKQAVILVEAIMVLLCKVGKMNDSIVPAYPAQLSNESFTDIYRTGNIMAFSELFCFKVNASAFLSPLSTKLKPCMDPGTLEKVFTSLLLEVANVDDIVESRWELLRGIYLSLGIDCESGNATLSISHQEVLSGPLRNSILMMIKMHVDIISHQLGMLDEKKT